MRARLGLVSLILTLAACTVPVTPSGTPAQREVSAKQPAATPGVRSVIEGVVRAPAGIIAAGGGNLIGHAGGNLIGHAGGNIIGNDSGSFAPRQLLAVAETPLAGVEVFLADAAGKPIPSIPSVYTDAQGRFKLPQVPPGYTFLVVAKVETAVGDAAALKTLTRSSEVGATADVDTATTFVSAAVLEGANELGELNLATFSRAVSTTGKHLEADKLPDLADQDAVLAFMHALSEEVAALKESVAQLKKDLAMVLERLDELEGKRQGTEPEATDAPESTPTPGATRAPDATPTPSRTEAPVTASGWTVRTLAGSGRPEFKDDRGVAASFNLPRGIGLGPDGVVYVADTGNDRIRQIDALGNVTTIAGIGTEGKSKGPINALEAEFSYPWDVERDASGRLFVSDTSNRMISVIENGQLSLFAGGSGNGSTSLDGTGAAAQFHSPRGIALTSAGDLVVVDSNSAGDALRTITVDAVVGTLTASVPKARDVVMDEAGNAYAVLVDHHTVVKVSPDGTVTTIAGQDGVTGLVDGAGTAALFHSPTGIARDSLGNLYVADFDNHRIRRIAPDGTVSTFAGTVGTRGDDGPVETTPLYYPCDVEVDADGRVYVCEYRGHRVRVIEK